MNPPVARITALAAAGLLAVACGDGVDPPPTTLTASEGSQALEMVMNPRDSLLREGEAAYREGMFEAALPLLAAAQDGAMAAGDSAAASVAMTWVGLTHWQMGEYGAARRVGEEALALKERLGLVDELARSLNALGLLAWTEGRLRDALVLHQHSLDAARVAGDSAGVARSLNNLALVHTDLGEFTLASGRYSEAEVAFADLDLPQFEARVLTNLGALYLDWGDPMRAERALTDAFELYARVSDPVGEINALGQLGIAKAAQGEPERGLELLDSATARARSLGLPVEEASNLEQLANIHAALGSGQVAMQLYEQAAAIYERLGLDSELGANLRARAMLYRQQGNAPLAVPFLDEALALHRTIGATGEVFSDLLEKARALEPETHGTALSDVLAEVESLASTLGSPRAELEVVLTKAELAEGRAEWAGIVALLSTVDDRRAEAPADVRWRLHYRRAQALAGLGDPSAVEEGRAAVAVIEEVRSTLTSDLLGTSLANARADTYHLLMDLLLDEGRVVEAFEVAEMSRSRAVARERAMAVVQGRRPDPELASAGEREELLARLAHLDATLDERYLGVPPPQRDPVFEREVAELRTQRDAARRSFSRLLAEASREPGTTTYAFDIADIRRALATDELLLSFVETQDRLVLFAATSDGVRALTIAVTREELAARVRVARALAGSQGNSAPSSRHVLAELYALLISPLEREGILDGVGRVILVTDGTLAYLPLGALWDAAAERFLVERFSFQDSPSAAAFVAMRTRARRSTPGGTPTSMGFAPDPSELPASEDEVRSLAEILPGNVFVGAAATEKRLRETLGSGTLVHVAAHGRMNARNPLFSSLRLAPGGLGADDDGALHVHEMLAMRVDSPLVFLSGCETGTASAWAPGVVGGRDMATLSEALLAAGAEAVVATLWAIEDRSAADFARFFYEALRGTDPAQALAMAQRRMLAQEHTSAPFHWAGYRVAGQGRRVASAR